MKAAGTAKRLWSGKRVPNRKLFIGAGLAVSLGVMAYLILGHLGELKRIGEDVRWGAVAAAVACSLASYAMVGLALREVLVILGHRLSTAAIQGIALVSTTANYFVSSAGISGFALKAHLLHKRAVPYGTTVLASVVSSAIMYFVLAAIIAQGLLYLVVRLRGTRIAVLEGALGLGVILASSVALMVVMLDHELRGRVTRKLFHWINRAAFAFSHSEIPKEDFVEFESQVAAGLEKVRKDKRRLLRTILYTVLDWGCAMMTLHFCFEAVGVDLQLGHLSAGFTIGQAATLIPVIPGGLGAMESGMAAVFESLGVSWDRAFVAVLLYRMAYYVVPGLLSVFVLWGLKVSEPRLIENTVEDILPDELKRQAAELERRRRSSP